MERKETKRGVCKEAGSEAAVHDWSEVAVHDSGRGDLTMPDLDVRIGPIASIHGIVVTHFLERVSPRGLLTCFYRPFMACLGCPELGFGVDSGKRILPVII